MRGLPPASCAAVGNMGHLLIVFGIVVLADADHVVRWLSALLLSAARLGCSHSLIRLGVFDLDGANREKVTIRPTSGTAFTDAAIDVDQLAIVRWGAINRIGATGVSGGVITVIYGVGGRIGIGA